MQLHPLSLGDQDPCCICLPGCFAVVGHVPGIRDGGLDGGGEVSESDTSPITPVFGFEGLSRRLP